MLKVLSGYIGRGYVGQDYARQGYVCQSYVCQSYVRHVLACLTLMLATVVSFVAAPVAWAADVHSVRLWRAPDHTRLVFDLSGPVTHAVFPLSNPNRLVLDIPSSDIGASLHDLDLANTPIERIRSGRRNGKDLRVVLDLKKHVQPRSFELPPNAQYGHRLVVDLVDLDAKKAKVVHAVKPQQPAAFRDVVIAIDAGHGGEDPGAIGPGGIREKDVVLAISKQLARYLASEPGFRPVLTREGDYYVALRKRKTMVRKHQPDLFVSIHADAFHKPQANGASVWSLSQRGASSEMGRWLAGRENNTDLVGGVGTLTLDDKEDVLKEVLLDMSMTASLSDSREVGSYVLKNMGSVARLHKNQVQHAGFVVLKSPDIPSILVETGFISNPRESKLLRSKNYQDRIAKAIFYGVKQHFTNKPPAQSYLANVSGNSSDSRYRVVKGDTLSMIATRNGVSLNSLRVANNLKGDVIRVGQVLQIPAS